MDADDGTQLFHGKGRLTHATGDVYTGSFERGQKQGEGKLEAKAFQYEGEWSHGVRAGQGTLTWVGSSYCGQFENDEMRGAGMVVRPPKSRSALTLGWCAPLSPPLSLQVVSGTRSWYTRGKCREG